MGMMINRRRVCGGEKLPYDAEIEYLESSGTQYIDTGIKGSNTLKTELCLQELTLQRSVGIFGVYEGTKAGHYSYYIYQSGASDVWRTGYGTQLINTSTTTNTNKNTFLFNDNKLYLNGNVIQSFTPITFTTTQNLTLFGVSNFSGTLYPSVAKRIYYCRMWNNGVLVRDFIPVKVNNVGYMYDKVTKQLFGNIGTGVFILGSDK